jgi:hypothetical protein
VPEVISPTKMPFSLLGPNAVELKNSISVTPLDSAQLKTGSRGYQLEKAGQLELE